MNRAIFYLSGLKLAPVVDTPPDTRVSAQEAVMAAHLAFWQATDVDRWCVKGCVFPAEQVCFMIAGNLCLLGALLKPHFLSL